MVSPAACPAGGCAAGQTLGMRFSFDPTGYDFSQTPNVKVCVFAPTSWLVDPASITVETTGEVTGEDYIADTSANAGCAQNVSTRTTAVSGAPISSHGR